MKFPHMANYKRTETYNKLNYKWNTSIDTGDDDFTNYVDQIINNNKSIHIDGRGGTGKSTLIKQLQQRLTEMEKKYISLAPTNIAARIINGQTIHKYLTEQNSKTMKNHQKLDYIFVDEISMVPEMFYKLFILIKKAISKYKIYSRW